jgi:hypothetical protein
MAALHRLALQADAHADALRDRPAMTRDELRECIDWRTGNTLERRSLDTLTVMVQARLRKMEGR